MTDGGDRVVECRMESKPVMSPLTQNLFDALGEHESLLARAWDPAYIRRVIQSLFNSSMTIDLSSLGLIEMVKI